MQIEENFISAKDILFLTRHLIKTYISKVQRWQEFRTMQWH